MKISEVEILLKKEPKEIDKALKNLINSERNKKIEIHRDYLDDKHWLIDGDHERTNKTRSGKLIWGKYDNGALDTDDGGLIRKSKISASGNTVAFHKGQLQTENYIKLFLHTYQDFIAGINDEDDITVEFEPDKEDKTEYGDIEEINTFLEELWPEPKKFLKSQVSRMVIDTIAGAILVKDGEDYYVELPDVKEIFPIYRGSQHVGTIRTYMISGAQAKDMGFNDPSIKDDEQVSYAKIYYRKKTDAGKDQYVMFKLLAGKFIKPNTENENDSSSLIIGDSTPNVLMEELNFDPFSFVPNLDHPNHDYDENHLEDSEIFSWIDKNDALNANKTIEFVANQYLASPKVSIDFELAQKLNIKIDSPEFKQSLANFQFAPGSIDSLPIKVNEGKGIPESFYKGVDSKKKGLFEDASIPMFIVSAEGMANVTTETLQLGMSMMVRKITQKRQQLVELIKMVSVKALQSKGLLKDDVKINKLPIKVNLPNINGLTAKEFIEVLAVAQQNNWIPQKYGTQEFLKSVGRAEDLDEVENAITEDENQLRAQIDAEKAKIANEKIDNKQSAIVKS